MKGFSRYVIASPFPRLWPGALELPTLTLAVDFVASREQFIEKILEIKARYE